MQFHIHTQGFELTDGIRDHIDRHLQFAFDWADHELGKIIVRLYDINGPRGGNDKRCHVRIPLPRSREVVVEDTSSNLYVAIDRAIDRASRALARRLSRQREFAPIPRSAFSAYGEKETTLVSE